MKLSVVIPVYNEQQTIGEVIERVQEVGLEKEIIIVDDGSTDGTSAVLDQNSQVNVKVIHLAINSGKGSAIREGLLHVTGDVVVIQDADLELDPNEYHQMLGLIQAGKSRVVYGSRFLNGQPGMRLTSRLANRALTLLINLLYGGHLTDMETAYKMFGRDVIAGIELACQRFEFEPEITAKLLKRGERIIEVPVAYSPRTREEGKKIGWRDGLQALATILRYRFAD